MSELEAVIREAVDRGFTVLIWKEHHVIVQLNKSGRNWVCQLREETPEEVDAAVIRAAMLNFEYMEMKK